MKIVSAAAAILLAALLGGCVAVNLDYSLDAKGHAEAAWKIEAKPSGQDQNDLEKQGMLYAHTEFSKMQSHWEDAGMETSTDEANGAISVTARRTADGAGEQSFQSLESWMKDSAFSPFSAVKSNHLASEFVEEYMLDAQIDWKDLVDPASLAAVPSALRTGTQKVLNTAKITVSISLPGKATEHEGNLTESGGVTTCTVTASPGKPARIMLHTRIEKEFTPVTTAEKTDAFRQWSLVAVCALDGLLMLVLAVRIIIKIVRYYRY